MSDSCLQLRCSFLYKKHSRARQCLWSPRLFPFRAYHLPTMGLLVGTLGTIPMVLDCIGINSCQKIDKTRHSVSITLLSYWGPIWMCWLHNPISCLQPPTVEAGSTVAANLALVIFEEKLCLRASCTCWNLWLNTSLSMMPWEDSAPLWQNSTSFNKILSMPNLKVGSKIFNYIFCCRCVQMCKLFSIYFSQMIHCEVQKSNTEQPTFAL